MLLVSLYMTCLEILCGMLQYAAADVDMIIEIIIVNNTIAVSWFGVPSLLHLLITCPNFRALRFLMNSLRFQIAFLLIKCQCRWLWMELFCLYLPSLSWQQKNKECLKRSSLVIPFHFIWSPLKLCYLPLFIPWYIIISFHTLKFEVSPFNIILLHCRLSFIFQTCFSFYFTHRKW